MAWQIWPGVNEGNHVSENIAGPEEEWSINQVIEITGGAFTGFQGTIALIEDRKKTVIVKVNPWGKIYHLCCHFFKLDRWIKDNKLDWSDIEIKHGSFQTKFRGALMGASVRCYVDDRLFIGDNQPEEQVEQEPRHSTRQEGDQERQAEPKSTDAKEIC
jgi:hypothetical protein